MKTNTNITQKTSLYFFIGFLSLLVTSCGSYQNSSYYESDGIYGTNGDKIITKGAQNNSASVQYKEYFNSLQSTDQSSGEIFTDINNYNDNKSIVNDSIQSPTSGYAGWGGGSQQTVVSVYPDSYWSIGFGFGFGYPYYGYGYGWGYPYYGWGYPYYSYGYPYYGYGWGYPSYGYGCGIASPYAYNYNYSRRGSSYAGTYNNTTYGRNYNARNSTYSRNNTYNNSTYNRNGSYSRNGYTNSNYSRTSPTFTNRNSNTSTRGYSQGQSRNNYNQYNRANSSSSQNYQRSSNSYTPSNNSYRSSGGSMSSGGGGYRTSGGGGMSGGGGRMSGGGGGGRR